MNNRDKFTLIAILLFFVSGYLLFQASHNDLHLESKSNGTSKSQSSKPASDLANEHLKITSMRMELEKQRAEIENSKNSPMLHEVKQQPRVAETQQDLSLMGEADLSSMSQEPQQQFVEPKYEIMYQVYKKQQEAELTEAYKAAYAREFIENARKNGYEIVLDSQYRIVSTKRIKKPEAPGNSIFDLKGGNAR